MALGVLVSNNPRLGRLSALLPWGWLGLALASTSCTPTTAFGSAELAVAQATPALLIALDPAPAPLLPTVSPIAPAATIAPQLASASFTFRGTTPLDQLRSQDCLAQAIYYEAASESEEGQRAVAQVVLNRVRHPSWPNSVCGVVYQGPMRAGGGCQFTFTCDGSLHRPASGPAWAQARRIAAEALAGRSVSAVGLATHYHTHAVSPAWAPRLTRIGAIGAHNFYRLPGRFGEAGAFAARYTGSEPLPRPTAILFPRRGLAGLSAATISSSSDVLPANEAHASAPPYLQTPAAAEPPSTIREEYRHSGQWRADAPAAIAGR